MQMSRRFAASRRPIHLRHAAVGRVGVVPWQVVGDSVPRRLGSDEDVRGGADVRVVVKAAGGDHRPPPIHDHGHDRAAGGAKGAGEAGRGFVLPNHLGARYVTHRLQNKH